MTESSSVAEGLSVAKAVNRESRPAVASASAPAQGAGFPGTEWDRGLQEGVGRVNKSSLVDGIRAPEDPWLGHLSDGAGVGKRPPSTAQPFLFSEFPRVRVFPTHKEDEPVHRSSPLQHPYGFQGCRWHGPPTPPWEAPGRQALLLCSPTAEGGNVCLPGPPINGSSG